MLRRIFCRHSYKYYNTKVSHSLVIPYGYNTFQFVCTKCHKTAEVNEVDIMDRYTELESEYKKSVVLGKDPIEDSKLLIPRHRYFSRMCNSPAATLIIEEYLGRGIDLREISMQ